ncbi:LysM peptidoglycan-binding domain-containing protein [candidate division WOR-3 bacterium]|nr:LysM peptidoglycan-binding domain-containing protein [candidate division WOR-3 bacterium]
MIMRRSLFILSGIAILTVSLAYAQEEKKLTEEQALELIEGYKAKEEIANTKIEEEKQKVETLKSEITELDANVDSLKAKITGIKSPKQEVTEKKEIKKVETGKQDIYVVKPGDWLVKLAEYPKVYGKGNYAKWTRIYEANKEFIKDPNLIYPGWELKIPRP